MADNGIKGRLAALSDSELYGVISAVCAAAGMDAKKTRQMTSDIPRLRRMLSSLSEKQIGALISSLGKDDLQELMQKLGPT